MRRGRYLQVAGQLAVGRARGVEYLIAFFDPAAQVDDLLLQFGDPALELVDVGGSAQPGLSPYLLAEHFGQLVLQLQDADRLPVDLALRVRRVRLKGTTAESGAVISACGKVGP